MKELVEVIAKALVEKPEAVQVTEESDGKHVTVKLKVDPADIKIICSDIDKTSERPEWLR